MAHKSVVVGIFMLHGISFFHYEEKCSCWVEKMHKIMKKKKKNFWATKFLITSVTYFPIELSFFSVFFLGVDC